MSDRSTESLLRDLSAELAPVRPVPRLGVVFGALIAAFAVAIGASSALGLPVPGLASGVPWRSAAYLGLLAGLGALAFGGLVAGLAGAVPGRDAALRGGRASAWIGAGLCAGASVAWCLEPGAFDTQVPLGASLLCLARATGLALLPALVACVAIARAFDVRRRAGAVWACVGAVSLGALAVHASCRAGGASHVLLGHLVEPLVLAVLLGGALAPWLRQRLPSRASA
jgi:hypothetical protein